MCSGEDSLPGSQPALLLVVEGVRDLSGTSFIRALIPPMRALRSVPNPLHLLTPSSWRLNFNIWILGEHKHSDHSIDIQRQWFRKVSNLPNFTLLICDGNWILTQISLLPKPTCSLLCSITPQLSLWHGHPQCLEYRQSPGPLSWSTHLI